MCLNGKWALDEEMTSICNILRYWVPMVVVCFKAVNLVSFMSHSKSMS